MTREQEVIEPYPVYRAFALDSSRAFSIGGKYPGILALPDRWATWYAHAVWMAKRIISEHRPAAILSTYPIATAHLIALKLSRRFGLPWVADFRDPMLDDHYPKEQLARWVRKRLENATLRHCAAVTVTTPGAAAHYSTSANGMAAGKVSIVMNGFDEDDFNQASTLLPPDKQDDRWVLLHSGVLYPSIRDPKPFFQALASLRKNRIDLGQHLRVVLRASGPEAHHQALIDRYCLSDIVELARGTSYHEALSEMVSADGLLLFQGSGANAQVPAKLFEYMRAGKPILAMVDKDGDTAAVLRQAGCSGMAAIDSATEIESVIAAFIDANGAPNGWAADPHVASRYSRRASAQGLAEALERAVSMQADNHTSQQDLC